MPKLVAVVIDPIQSVKGKVVIDAFRTISTQSIMLGLEPRQTTSNLGHLQKPSIQGKNDYRQETHHDSSADPWSEQKLLLNAYRLQKK